MGDALDKVSGLDLRRTVPPIAEIVEFLFQRFDTTDELRARFDWSALRIYGLNGPGENHGVLLGTRAWRPSGEEPAR